MILIKVNLTFITIRYDCCIDVNIRLGSDRPPRAMRVYALSRHLSPKGRCRGSEHNLGGAQIEAQPPARTHLRGELAELTHSVQIRNEASI